MNTAIGHLENIMEQQQQQQNTNEAQQKHYHTLMIYPWQRNGVALDVVVVERLQFSSKTQKKRMNTYENKIKKKLREWEWRKKKKKPNTEITQRPKCIKNDWGKGAMNSRSGKKNV
jgi:hypothetical protein